MARAQRQRCSAAETCHVRQRGCRPARSRSPRAGETRARPRGGRPPSPRRRPARRRSREGSRLRGRSTTDRRRRMHPTRSLRAHYRRPRGQSAKAQTTGGERRSMGSGCARSSIRATPVTVPPTPPRRPVRSSRGAASAAGCVGESVTLVARARDQLPRDGAPVTALHREVDPQDRERLHELRSAQRLHRSRSE